MGKFTGIIIPLVLCLLFSGCSAPAQVETVQPIETTEITEATTAPTETEPVTEPVTMDAKPEAEAMEQAPPPAVAVVLEAEPSGVLEERCEAAVIDYSNTSDGYVMVRYLVSAESRLKVLVKGPSTTYSYNLPVDEWTVFPLSDGNGDYQIGV